MGRGDQEAGRKEGDVSPEEIKTLKVICETWKKAGLNFPQTIRIFPRGILPENDRDYYDRIQPISDKIESGEL